MIFKKGYREIFFFLLFSVLSSVNLWAMNEENTIISQQGEEKTNPLLLSILESYYELTLIQSESFIDKDQRTLWEKLLFQLINDTYNFTDEVHYINRDDLNDVKIDHVNDDEYVFRIDNLEQVVPIVIYKPKKSSIENKVPVLIYVHGGPASMIAPGGEKVLFALAAQLGYAVVAPNYRGSTFNSKYSGLLAGHFPEYPIEDLKSTINYVKTNLDWVDPSKIVLSGISTGTYINALTLESIAKDLAGVILSQGEYEPTDLGKKPNNPSLEDKENPNVFTPEQYELITNGNRPFLHKLRAKYHVQKIPDNLPILFIHGGLDPTTSLINAMEYYHALVKTGKNVKKVIVPHGNHYLIRVMKPGVKPFNLANFNPSQENLKKLIRHTEQRYNHKEIREALVKIVHFLDHVKQSTYHAQTIVQNTKGDKKLALSVINKAKLNTQIKSLKKDQEIPKFVTTPYTQSNGDLKLILGDSYINNDPKANLESFFKLLKNQFPERKYLDINSQTLDSFTAMLNEEEKHPQMYAAYHAGNREMMFLYDFYTELRRLIMLNHDTHSLRILDNVFANNLTIFMEEMQDSQSKTQENLLNFQKGYPDQGIAVNWTLTGSYLNEGSCTLCYFLQGYSANPVPVHNFIKRVILELGILPHYKDIDQYIKDNYIERILSKLPKDNGRMVQIFLSKNALEKMGYLSLVGGEPIYWAENENEDSTYSPTKLLDLLKESPEEIEKIMSQKRNWNLLKKAYKNVKKFHGSILPLNKGHFMETLQGRLFLKPSLMDDPNELIIKFYDLQPKNDDYLSSLKTQIEKDVSKWLRSNAEEIVFTKPLKPTLKSLHEMVKKNISDPPSSTIQPMTPHQALDLILQDLINPRLPPKTVLQYMTFLGEANNPYVASLKDSQKKLSLFEVALINQNEEVAQYIWEHNIPLQKQPFIDIASPLIKCGFSTLFKKVLTHELIQKRLCDINAPISNKGVTLLQFIIDSFYLPKTLSANKRRRIIQGYREIISYVLNRKDINLDNPINGQSILDYAFLKNNTLFVEQVLSLCVKNNHDLMEYPLFSSPNMSMKTYLYIHYNLSIDDEYLGIKHQYITERLILSQSLTPEELAPMIPLLKKMPYDEVTVTDLINHCLQYDNLDAAYILLGHLSNHPTSHQFENVLFHAIASQRDDLIEEMLKKYSDILEINLPQSNYPFVAQSLNNHNVSLAKQLLALGCDPDLYLEEKSPLYFAIKHKLDNIIPELFTKELDPRTVASSMIHAYRENSSEAILQEFGNYLAKQLDKEWLQDFIQILLKSTKLQEFMEWGKKILEIVLEKDISLEKDYQEFLLKFLINHLEKQNFHLMELLLKTQIIKPTTMISIDYQDTCLICKAVQNNNTDAIHLMLKYGLQPTDKIEVYEEEIPVIFYTIKEGKWDIVDLLLQNTSAQNIVVTYGDNPIPLMGYAVVEKNLPLIKLLAEKSADLNVGLCYAVKTNNYNLVKFFLEKGADNPNGTITYSNDSIPLIEYAAREDQLDIVKILIEYGANTDVKIWGNTTLIDYAKEKNWNTVISLIEK